MSCRQSAPRKPAHHQQQDSTEICDERSSINRKASYAIRQSFSKNESAGITRHDFFALEII